MKSFASKLLMVCGIGLLLLIGAAELRSIVNDRLMNRTQAQRSIAESLASEQTIAGVSLVIAYSELYQQNVNPDSSREPRMEWRRMSHQIEILPEQLDLAGNLRTDPRHRGLFRVNGYVLDGRLGGNFRVPALDSLARDVANSSIKLDSAYLALAISDPRGIRKLQMQLDGVSRTVTPGSGSIASIAGVHAMLDNVASLMGREAKFGVDLELVGTDSLSVVPLGRETTASIASSWQHPSFGGRFLPIERAIGEKGFDARWRVSSLASNTQTTWHSTRENGTAGADSFAVSLIDPVDIYVMAERAVKYAFLFVAITLGTFLLFELLRKLRLHALHYLLIGAALLIFFLLLLSLSEHLGFAMAYAIAASACVLLIGIYSSSLLRSKWLACGFTLGLGALYGALYVILLSEQNALLMGSLLIFGLLATVMLGTRKIDWHDLLAERLRSVTHDRDAATDADVID